MSEARRPVPSPAERLLARSREEDRPHGRELSHDQLTRERTVEGYLRGAVMPRWMERLREIHAGIERHRRDLAVRYDELRATFADDPEGFALAWHRLADRRSFYDVNELIAQHNEWFPVERQLPMDPRTGDYVLIAGRPYRREPLDRAWLLREFPAAPPDAPAPPG
jgi:hypothetical protein